MPTSLAQSLLSLPPEARARARERLLAEAERRGLYIDRYELRGAALALQECAAPEVLIAGPAGTGKSVGCLVKLHQRASRERIRGLIVRKTRESLTESGLLTWEDEVVGRAHPIVAGGPKRRIRQSYLYPHGSEVVVGGMDNPTKIMSTRYDVIYVQEATELEVKDWESLTTRFRGGADETQLLADCNPDASTHFLYRRWQAGRLTMLHSRHEDNPYLYDAHTREWTPAGVKYMARLDNLTGVRRERLRFGRWVSAEGMVYDDWSERLHVIPRADLPPLHYYIASQDWGWTNPGVLQIWGVDGDGRMYLVREHYRVQQSITWWARVAKEERDRYPFRTVQCDPSEPGFIAEYRKAGVPAAPAFNGIQLGIQAVQARLQPAGDGRPRLYVVDDALAERDALIAEDQSSSLLTERPRYVWAAGADGKPNKEQPVDAFNHAQDAERYACAYLDHLGDKRPMEAAAGAKRADWS